MPKPDGVFVITALRSDRKTPCGLPEAEKEETAMSHTDFPDDWDDDKVRRVIARYEMQTEVPHDLVSTVRQLIAKNRE
jgi:hypothetical protein